MYKGVHYVYVTISLSLVYSGMYQIFQFLSKSIANKNFSFKYNRYARKDRNYGANNAFDDNIIAVATTLDSVRRPAPARSIDHGWGS